MIAAAAVTEVTSGSWGTIILSCAWVVGYLGFVMLVGTSFFLTWLWPEGRVVPVFARLLGGGAALSIIASVTTVLAAAPAVGWDAFSGREGACALARMALVVLAITFMREYLASARSHRVLTTVLQLAIIETYVVSSDSWSEPWRITKIVATTGHLAATAAWLGGLLTLVAVLVPRSSLDVLHEVLPKFSIVAFVSVVVLTISGTIHSLAIAGSIHALFNSAYGTALILKVAVFGVMLVLGNVGRHYAAHNSNRKVSEIDDTAPPETIQAFAVAIGAEFALAMGVLAATAALVHFVPGAH